MNIKVHPHLHKPTLIGVGFKKVSVLCYITMMAGEAKSQMGDSPYSKMLDNSHLAGS